VELCAALPMTATGKLMRSELKQMAANVRPRAKERLSDRG
jgi:acyl-coenzyme A synthetase/AMP-(fatty) acid ligase